MHERGQVYVSARLRARNRLTDRPLLRRESGDMLASPALEGHLTRMTGTSSRAPDPKRERPVVPAVFVVFVRLPIPIHGLLTARVAGIFRSFMRCGIDASFPSRDFRRAFTRPRTQPEGWEISYFRCWVTNAGQGVRSLPMTKTNPSGGKPCGICGMSSLGRIKNCHGPVLSHTG